MLKYPIFLSTAKGGYFEIHGINWHDLAEKSKGMSDKMTTTGQFARFGIFQIGLFG
jgi:hypothetical protein